MNDDIEPDDIEAAHEELQPSPLEGDEPEPELWVADRDTFEADSFDPPSAISSQEANYAMGAHLAGFAGVLLPFGNILGPLVVWLLGKDKGAFADYNGKEALNFNISFMIYLIVALVSLVVLIGLVLVPIVVILWLVFTITATIRASNKQTYRYPLTIRFVN